MSTVDLITGLQSAIGAYAKADEAKKARQERRAERDLELASKGLLAKYDENGKLLGIENDPVYLAKKEKEKQDEYNFGLLKVGLIPAGMDPALVPKVNTELYNARAEANPVKKMLGDIAVKKGLRELSDPYSSMSESEKTIAKDSAKKLSDLATIQESMNSVINVLDDPNVTEEQRLVAAKSALKLINSASLAAPDVVGAEEAARVGALLNPSLSNLMPGQAGPGPLSKPNVGGFKDQLKLISEGMTERRRLLAERSGLPKSSGLLKQPSGLITQPKPSAPPPGSIINMNGQKFRVGADGDTLEPVK